MADARTIKRIKLMQVKPYGDPVEVEMPKGAEILEAGWAEGIFNVWACVPVEGEVETLKLRLLNAGNPFDPDEFELLHLGVRPNGEPIALLKAKA